MQTLLIGGPHHSEVVVIAVNKIGYYAEEFVSSSGMLVHLYVKHPLMEVAWYSGTKWLSEMSTEEMAGLEKFA